MVSYSSLRSPSKLNAQYLDLKMSDSPVFELKIVINRKFLHYYKKSYQMEYHVLRDIFPYELFDNKFTIEVEAIQIFFLSSTNWNQIIIDLSQDSKVEIQQHNFSNLI